MSAKLWSCLIVVGSVGLGLGCAPATGPSTVPATSGGDGDAVEGSDEASGCTGVCDACWSALEDACARCPEDPDCDDAAEQCSSAQELEQMFGCDACASGLAEEAACDNT
jgi:hypothetical protein